MKILTLWRALAVVAAPALAIAPSTGFAAHAGDPYLNVDRSNDMGNDTGNSRVEGLNDQQRNANYRGPLELRAPIDQSAHGTDRALLCAEVAAPTALFPRKAGTQG